MANIDSLEKLISAFRSLPGVGYKTAQRYAYSILNMNDDDVKSFSNAMLNAKDKVKFCEECGNYSETKICENCMKNNAEVICVVAEPKDATIL